jgi:ABC-type multidrug transport system ATPase subunit
MLQIEALTKRYAAGSVALDQFNLELGPGVLGLLGPNGAGKTTLMSILATVLRPTSGSVRWKGIDALANPVAVRRVLGYLPQDFGVYDRLTAVEFLRYLGRLKGLSGRDLGASVDEMLDLVNLRSAASRPLASFSGGMRQRVGIAQALLGSPEIVIVDEPTVGLDPEERVRFRNLLSELAHGRVVILSTHIVSDVEAVADRIAVIRKGKLVRVATPGELLAHAAGRVFRVIVDAERLQQIQQSVAVSSIARKADGVHVRFVADTPRIGGAVEVEPTLEDAYLLTNVEAA